MNNPLALLFSGISISIAIGLMFNLALQAQDDLYQQLATQCEMHQLYADTEGEYGWPDYDGLLSRGDCKN